MTYYGVQSAAYNAARRLRPDRPPFYSQERVAERDFQRYGVAQRNDPLCPESGVRVSQCVGCKAAKS